MAPEKKKEKETAPRKTLSPAIRRFIVEELACYEPTKEVVKSVKERFKEFFEQNPEVAFDGQVVRSHDPTKARGACLSEGLKSHFYEVRKLFDDESKKNTIGRVEFRLSMRRVLLERAVSRGDERFAAQLLNEAAMDVGGRFTNHKVHSGPGGGPIEVVVEEKKRTLAATMLARRLVKGMSYGDAKKELLGLGVDERDLPDISE